MGTPLRPAAGNAPVRSLTFLGNAERIACKNKNFKSGPPLRTHTSAVTPAPPRMVQPATVEVASQERWNASTQYHLQGLVPLPVMCPCARLRAAG